MKMELLKNIVIEAGTSAISHFGKFSADYKPDRSPVTEADYIVQNYLKFRLTNIYPDYKFLAEENYDKSEIFYKNDHIWVIDPIDGTDAFREGIPIWGISVGLVYDFQPIAGIFYMPCSNRMFFCDCSGKAYENGRLIDNRDIQRSTNIYVPSDFHKSFFTNYYGKIRSLGSTAAHICFLARGAGSGAIINGHPWDIAAAMAILKATGGNIFTFSGEQFDFSSMINSEKQPEFLLASPNNKLPDFINYIHLK